MEGKEYCLEEMCVGGRDSYCDALVECYNNGGWLADVVTQEERRAISNSETFRTLGESVWTGLNGLGTSNDLNLASGKPNKYYIHLSPHVPPDGRCVFMEYPTGELRLSACRNEMCYMCQYRKLLAFSITYNTRTVCVGTICILTVFWTF